jgi:hypothetical protein
MSNSYKISLENLKGRGYLCLTNRWDLEGTECGYMDWLAQNSSNKVGEFLEHLSNYQLLKKNSASWSWFVRFDIHFVRIECIVYDDNRRLGCNISLGTQTTYR